MSRDLKDLAEIGQAEGLIAPADDAGTERYGLGDPTSCVTPEAVPDVPRRVEAEVVAGCRSVPGIGPMNFFPSPDATDGQDRTQPDRLNITLRTSWRPASLARGGHIGFGP